MSISSISSSTSSVNPYAGQNVAKPHVASGKDADGDTDGSTAAQVAAEKAGGVDVKG